MMFFRTSLLALLLIGAFAACHAPTAPPNTPTATLSLSFPDSAHVFDTVTFRAHYSGSLQPSWKFGWQFGDSSSATTKDSSTLHVYNSAGIYPVILSLNDSIGQRIAKGSGQIKVTARHFDLALLQSMRYITLTWQANVSDSQSGYYCNMYHIQNGIGLLTWNGLKFIVDSSYKFDFGFGSTYVDSGSGRTTIEGAMDSGLTKIADFMEDSSYNSDWYHGGTVWCAGKYSQSFAVADVPFMRESDTDVVFEAFGSLIKNPSYDSFLNLNFGSGFEGKRLSWNDSSYVFIRFHK